MEHHRLAALLAVLHLAILAVVFVAAARHASAHDAPSGWKYPLGELGFGWVP